MIAPSFGVAARRHLHDADMLDNNGRSGNAGHLYGIGAECALKAMLMCHGHTLDGRGCPVKVGSVKVADHINGLTISSTWSAIAACAAGRAAAKYLAMITKAAMFADWDVSHRYCSESDIPNSLANWREAAQEYRGMLDQAALDGLL